MFRLTRQASLVSRRGLWHDAGVALHTVIIIPERAG
jgi:hypothetical protein